MNYDLEHRFHSVQVQRFIRWKGAHKNTAGFHQKIKNLGLYHRRQVASFTR